MTKSIITGSQPYNLQRPSLHPCTFSTRNSQSFLPPCRPCHHPGPPSLLHGRHVSATLGDQGVFTVLQTPPLRLHFLVSSSWCMKWSSRWGLVLPNAKDGGASSLRSTSSYASTFCVSLPLPPPRPVHPSFLLVSKVPYHTGPLSSSFSFSPPLLF